MKAPNRPEEYIGQRVKVRTADHFASDAGVYYDAKVTGIHATGPILVAETTQCSGEMHWRYVEEVTDD